MVAAIRVLEAGASIEGKDDEGRAVLHHIMRRGKFALYYAVERGYTVAAIKLVEAGVSVEGKDDKGRTVLHLAAEYV